MPASRDLNLTVVSPTGEKWTLACLMEAAHCKPDVVFDWMVDNAISSSLLMPMVVEIVTCYRPPREGEVIEVKGRGRAQGWKAAVTGVGRFDPAAPPPWWRKSKHK